MEQSENNAVILSYKRMSSKNTWMKMIVQLLMITIDRAKCVILFQSNLITHPKSFFKKLSLPQEWERMQYNSIFQGANDKPIRLF
ncbi:MAG: hypothetical protein HPY76_02365 [Anaerolineae bacterium]|jgi:hypothetical protein|nr:hypothetical protein [Anaerolineae bacterium]